MFSNPPTLNTIELQLLKEFTTDWAICHGLTIRPTTQDGKVSNTSGIHAPLALLPTPFPKRLFDQAYQLQTHFNRLVHIVAEDHTFLCKVMKSLGDSDAFTSKLFSIYLELHKDGLLNQKISLGIFRSDYLMHLEQGETLSLRQVELNTIASSFACLSSLVSKLHYCCLHLPILTKYYSLNNIPSNPTTEVISQAFKIAYDKYNSPQAILLMVVQPNERNAFDQRHLEFSLFSKYQLRMIRMTLPQIHTECQLIDQRLFVNEGNSLTEIAIVYFRAGYTPEDYKDVAAWEARKKVEASLAIKCPSIAQQLVGTKKMQQVWAEDGVLERLAPMEADSIKGCFMELYPLDSSPSGAEGYRLAMEKPSEFVLKPQREGGGNNIYSSKIPEFISSISKSELPGYILMRRIRPPRIQGLLFRQGEKIEAPVISELGIYGAWVSQGDEILLNTAGGHLFRTKLEESDEGGVASGFAVLDSPYLV